MIAGLPMYDWPEVAGPLDELWDGIAAELRSRGIDAPTELSRPDHLEKLWRDPEMIVGQVCSLNPVRDGLGETEVLGTFDYEPPDGLPRSGPGTYYSVIACRHSDIARGATSVRDFQGARVGANGTDSQSGYWSLGHLVRDEVSDGPLFGPVTFTGAHRDTIRAMAEGAVDIAAIDVHSWRLALEYEPAVRELDVIATTDPTPGVVCVVSWELAHHRPSLRASVDDAIAAAVRALGDSPVLDALHIAGYLPRRLQEFQVVADQVEAAGHRPWHR